MQDSETPDTRNALIKDVLQAANEVAREQFLKVWNKLSFHVFKIHHTLITRIWLLRKLQDCTMTIKVGTISMQKGHFTTTVQTGYIISTTIHQGNERPSEIMGEKN